MDFIIESNEIYLLNDNNVDVIIDATNATVFDRKRSLDNFKDLNIFEL